MTIKEFRKKLRNMVPYSDEISIGDDVICKCSGGYGVRYKNDFSDPISDYCAWVFGFKEKRLIERYVKDGILKEEK